jgi:hypothetical protein
VLHSSPCSSPCSGTACRHSPELQMQSALRPCQCCILSAAQQNLAPSTEFTHKPQQQGIMISIWPSLSISNTSRNVSLQTTCSWPSLSISNTSQNVSLQLLACRYGTSHKELTQDPATGHSDWLSGSVNLFVSHDLTSWRRKPAVFSAAGITGGPSAAAAVAASRRLRALKGAGPYR